MEIQADTVESEFTRSLCILESSSYGKFAKRREVRLGTSTSLLIAQLNAVLHLHYRI